MTKIQIYILLCLAASVGLHSEVLVIPTQYNTIQMAADSANTGDTLLLEPGIYTESIYLEKKSITVTSRYMFSSDTNDIKNTIFDGLKTYGFFKVDSSIINIIGLVFQNGSKNISFPPIRVDHSKIRITNSKFIDNYYGILLTYSECFIDSCQLSRNSGSSVFVSYSLLDVYNSKFISNNDLAGAGIYSFASLTNCKNSLFKSNSARDWGGAIFLQGNSRCLLDSVYFIENTAGGRGGAIYNAIGCYLNINNSVFYGDSARWEGAIATEYSDTLIIQNTRFINNKAKTSGAFRLGNTLSFIRNSIFAFNEADSAGAIFFSEENHNIINCTFNNNKAQKGADFYIKGTAVSLINSIINNEEDNNIYFNKYSDPNSLSVAYSNISGGQNSIITNNNGSIAWLDGNIDQDPRFSDSENNDFTLKEDSPCIDAGSAFFIWQGDTLLNLTEDQFNGSAPDMGAFESSYVTKLSESNLQPQKFSFSQNYPNPFNLVTTINYEIPVSDDVTLKIYDTLGRIVKTLVNQKQTAGKYKVIFDATSIASGVYYYTLKTDQFEQTRKMILVK